MFCNESKNCPERLFNAYRPFVSHLLTIILAGNHTIDRDALESQIIYELIAYIELAAINRGPVNDEVVLAMCRTIVRKRTLDAMKRSHRRKRSSVEVSYSSETESCIRFHQLPTDDIEIEEYVEFYLSSLTECDRTLVSLIQKGFELRDIGKVLGLSVRSIQIRLRVLENKLRHQLDWPRRGTRAEGQGTGTRDRDKGQGTRTRDKGQGTKDKMPVKCQ
jgi:hypothetical protein